MAICKILRRFSSLHLGRLFLFRDYWWPAELRTRVFSQCFWIDLSPKDAFWEERDFNIPGKTLNDFINSVGERNEISRVALCNMEGPR